MRTFIRLGSVSLIRVVPAVKITASMLLMMALWLAVPYSAVAAIYTVCAGPAACDFATLEAAVDNPALVDTDTIDVTTGTYILTATLQIDKSITILGNDSVIDGNGNRVFDVAGAGTNFSLSSVTILNGQAPAGFGGGAMQIADGATVTVVSAYFEDNQADFGGAIHNIGSTLYTNAVVFSGNRATAGDGGALLTDSLGISTLNNTTVDRNIASNAGGGLAVSANDPEDEHHRSVINLSQSTISRNAAVNPSLDQSNDGSVSGSSCANGESAFQGQIFLPTTEILTAFEFEVSLGSTPPTPGTVLFGRVRFGNQSGPVVAEATVVWPTGLPAFADVFLHYELDVPVSVVPGSSYVIEIDTFGGLFFSINTNFGTNPYAGGSSYSSCGGLAPTNDYDFRTFGGATGEGGGIHSSLGGHAGMVNTTISGNVGDGATATSGGIVSTWFNTITNNSGNGTTAIPGGGTDALVFITATILAGNGGDDCNGTAVTSGFNLIADNTGCVFAPSPNVNDVVGTGAVPVDPLLEHLQNNGGHTETHAIAQGSPAFNAAGPALAVPCSERAQDQRDVSRPFGPACDIGAFEFVVQLQPLIDLAGPGATIIVPDGTYNEAIFIGDGKTLRGSSSSNVVIDVTGLNVSAITATGDFTLEDIRVTGGNSGNDGGGINADVSETHITLTRVLFDNNIAASDGGAIYLRSNNSATITDSDFRLNQAGNRGGAIATTGPLDSSFNVYDQNEAIRGGAISTYGESSNEINSSDDIFTDNTATFSGGAIYNSTADLNVDGGIFQSNIAGTLFTIQAGEGGAIYTDQNSQITESVFVSNQAIEGESESGYGPGRGGAIINLGTLTLVDSTIEASMAGLGGGFYNNGFATATITGTTMHNNNADGSGTAGGAIGGGGNIVITNSTLAGNTAIDAESGRIGNGGGIGLFAGTARLNNVTLANNAVSGQGGPFYANQGALISLSNSLLSGNTGGATNCVSVTSLGYNLFQTSLCTPALSDIVGAPQIAVLASNGGLTQTHALLASSPAVDAGQPIPKFPQFDAGNMASLQTLGAARLDAGTLLLADETQTLGSAFVPTPIDPDVSFSAEFQFQITTINGPGNAADGFTFTISSDPTILGGAGGLLGIAVYDSPGPGATGVINGVSVEFDTWVNGEAESANDAIASDHIGIDINGSLSSVALAYVGEGHGVLSDGNVWTAWIDYDAASFTLNVRAANDEIRPAEPTVSYVVDIADLTGPDAYVSFTGATAGNSSSGQHRILSFSFANSCETVDQRGNSRPEGSACDIGSFEGASIPLALGEVVLSTQTLGEELPGGMSYPGVIDVPLIDIPIEKLTGDTFNAPESAPLGSFPLGSFPIGSFDMQASPLGSFPLGSFPIGSFPIGSFPLGSFPLSSIPLLSTGGWTEILNSIPELAGTPLQSVTLEQLLTLSPLPSSIAGIALRELAIQDSPLASLSLPSLSLGSTSVAELDQWATNADPTGAEEVCAALSLADSTFTDCQPGDTLLGLEVKGAPVKALSLSSLPLGSFPIGSFPLGSFPIGSFPLGSFPLGSFPLGSFPIGSFPIGSFPIGSFPLGSFNLLAAPTASLPLGSFPIGSFPLGSFEIDGKSFCEFYDEKALDTGAKTCADLSINPATASLADLLAALQADSTAGTGPDNIASTPLGSFPMGSFPIGSFPIGSFGVGVLSAPPLSVMTLDDFQGCLDIDGTTDCSTIASLSGASTLLDVATEFGTLAASPLGSFPLGSFPIADLPMGSFPLGSFEVNGAPLGSFPLGSFDLLTSPLGSFPIGSFAALIDGPCADCETLADAAKAGVISSTATLNDLAGSTEFDATTLGTVLNAMTLAVVHGPGTLADIKDPGNLTLGQLLVAMMLKTDFPWETIPLAQLDAQKFSADSFVAYNIDIPLTGTESEPVGIAVTISDQFMYVDGSARLDVATQTESFFTEALGDPTITDNSDGTQTLIFDMFLGGFSDNTIRFTAIPAIALGDFPATAEVTLGIDDPVAANNDAGTVTVIPAPFTDISSPDGAPTAPADVLLLGFIDDPDDNDYYRVAPNAQGDRVAVFMSNPAGDNDLIMYEPLSTVEAKGQLAEATALDSVPFEDDGVDYEGNVSEEPNALEDVNLAAAPLASISTNRGGLDEAVSAIAGAAPTGDPEPFIIQVSGYNGAISDQPYTLRVKVTPQVEVPLCSARNWPSESPSVLPAGTWMPDTNTVFLVNANRLASSDPAGAQGADDALTAINNLINAPGVTNGVVVDVSDLDISGLDRFGVNAAYTRWDANPCDVGAANDIVNGITQYLEEMRVASPDLAYVTIVGSDEVIPFARKPDETSIANESTYAGEFADNAMFGALVTRHFLSDDTYGDIDPIAWLDRYLNVPELGVGRLVESAADIQLAAENYIAFSGVLDPRSALSAGYDFIADASEEIDETFRAYSPLLGYVVEPALIDPVGITPASAAWTRTDFLDATGINTANPVDLVSFNMHFDFDEALPSIGDATHDVSGNLLHVSDLDGVDLTGGIWFTVGCHSGSSVADVSVVGAPSQDWAQTFSAAGALYLAQNAYGLGDTEAVALTERLMANFARNLDGSMTIGQAHAFAKQQYFADLGLYGEYDFKALQAATLFGLPMYQYGMSVMPMAPPPPVPPPSGDPLSGLASTSWSMPDTGITQSATSKGDLFSVDGEVQFVHFRPLQPIVRRDVTGPNGEVASGAFLTTLTTEDKAVPDIAFARPVIDLASLEPEIESDEVVFPTAFTNIASFKAPSPSGGPFVNRQQLNVIVGQFTSPPGGGTGGTERLFRNFEAQVFYRPNGPAPFAFGPLSGDVTRPELDNVQATVTGSSGTQQASFSVEATDAGGVVRVAVLYLQSVTVAPGPGSAPLGHWVLVDLVHESGTNTWTGGGPLNDVPGGQIDYMVQAVDTSGNVANSTFKGLFYVAEELPPPPDPGSGPGSIGVVVSVGGEVVESNEWITTDPVDVQITDQALDVSYEYSVDFAPFEALPPTGFQIDDDGVHTVTVRESTGHNPVTFVVLIDTKAPQAVITTPTDGGFVVQGQEPAAEFDCLDAGSGIASCTGTVADGAGVPAASTGRQNFVVTAQDDAELGPTTAESTYFVVKPLETSAPVGPGAITDPVTVNASATDLAEFNETVTIDWGDGSPLEAVDLTGGSVDAISSNHVYPQPGVYLIMVRVDYEGQFSQLGRIDLVTVFDPDGASVSGRGSIISPAGAHTPDDPTDATLEGKIDFDFSLKYKFKKPKKGKGDGDEEGQWELDGKTKFHFHATGLRIDSKVHNWMVVSGAHARYRGEVKTKGKNGKLYKFQVTMLDADISSAVVTTDSFRIRIWQEDATGVSTVIYDNGMGASDSAGVSGTTPLSDGNIKIQPPKKKK